MVDFKVFGVGMSKTGTSTLGAVFAQLGLTPTVGYDAVIKHMLQANRPINKVNGKFKYDPRSPQIDGMVDSVLQLLATPFRSFYDTPWYMLYRSLDEYFPGSKFILTLRRDAMTQALSDWNHNRTLGKCHGDMPEAYGEEQMRVYVEHNAAVLQYFQDRPDDLLTVCWEAGDSWNKVCDFLGVPVPDITFPHKLKGNYSKG